nr:hypothetical protein [Tanacetum cinerariifolium]
MVCVSGAYYSICVNDSLHGCFKGKRGLRQGDPLSPYLFTLVMEILTLLLHRSVWNSDDFQYHHLCDKQRIINLCFVDDLFLFARGHPSSVSIIMDALEEFKQVLGLVPRIPKSIAYFCNVPNAIKASILNSMPFPESVLPVRIKSLHEVTVVKVYVTAVKLNLVFFRQDMDGVLRPFSIACAWDTIRYRADVVWFKVRVLCSMDVIAPSLIDVVYFIIPISKSKTVVSVLSRIVVPATCYYIWLRRNERLFKKKSSSPDQIVDLILSMVRLKLVTFKFKKMSTKSHSLLDQWKIPSYYIVLDESTRELGSWVNERQKQTTKEKVDTSKALDASLVDIESSGTESKEQDTCSKSRNDAHADDVYIRPIYDEEPMAKVDQNAKQCHDTCPLPAKLTDNQIAELSNQSVESENICLKKTVAQFQKDFSKLEAHCINLELQLQNNVLKSRTTRAKTIENTTSLIAKNNEFKAQLQEKGFAIAALKNELRKLTGNRVNTKFAKSSILGKLVLQPHKNQFVVRQPIAFKSERPRISKPRFSSQVNVNNDLSKPFTTHYLPKEKEYVVAKPNHMIAPGLSMYSSNNMVHNHYLEEAKKKTQESSRNSKPSVMPSSRS